MVRFPEVWASFRPEFRETFRLSMDMNSLYALPYKAFRGYGGIADIFPNVSHAVEIKVRGHRLVPTPRSSWGRHRWPLQSAFPQQSYAR